MTECDRYFMTCRFAWIFFFSLGPIDFHWLLRVWSQGFGFIWRMLEMRWFLRDFSHISNVVSNVFFCFRNMCFFFKDIFFTNLKLIQIWISEPDFVRTLTTFLLWSYFRQVGKNYGRENNKIFGGKLRPLGKSGQKKTCWNRMPELRAFGDGDFCTHTQ